MKLSEDSIRQEIKYKVFFIDEPKLYDGYTGIHFYKKATVLEW